MLPVSTIEIWWGRGDRTALDGLEHPATKGSEVRVRRGFGGAEGDRTPDLVIANDALSQLSYGPKALAYKRRRITWQRHFDAGQPCAKNSGRDADVQEPGQWAIPWAIIGRTVDILMPSRRCVILAGGFFATRA